VHDQMWAFFGAMMWAFFRAMMILSEPYTLPLQILLLLLCNRLMPFLEMLSYIFGCYHMFCCVLRGLDPLSVCTFNLRSCCYQFVYLGLSVFVIGAIRLCYQFVDLALQVCAVGVLWVF